MILRLCMDVIRPLTWCSCNTVFLQPGAGCINTEQMFLLVQAPHVLSLCEHNGQSNSHNQGIMNAECNHLYSRTCCVGVEMIKVGSGELD